MTVLKSFDLKGNKQSFAGWISNLSPCDTPFVSMIGKESVSQAQYSWQMDALDAPKYPGFEEGSEVESDKREPTHVTHNFTSTLRKVAQVSDTTASISLYGRDSEMNYQMSKVGKEIKRDMEFMCLNNGAGNIGTGSLASKFSGFIPLCAPKGYIDHSTGAETYKEITVSNLSGPWFKSADLFDLTYNLYLAGSKANKIMFHPRHATTFSDFIGHNFESGTTFRMFDGVDTKYNAQVSKIRDPLGQNYDLISNRFMPADKIYIFTESDWTQMILRQPTVSKLGKQGSAERFLVEAEIGLRHRHVNASGVLDMAPSTLIMEWIEKPTKLTAGIGQMADVSVLIKERSTGNTVPDTTTFVWTSSNPLVVEVTDPTGHTADGKANSILKPLVAGTSIITVSSQDGFASYLVTVGNPSVKLTLPSPLMEIGQTSLAVAFVTDHAGKPLENITVNFYATPSNLSEFTPATTTTTAGTAQVEIKALKLGLVEVQAKTSTVNSNYAALHIVKKVELLSMEIPQPNIAFGINDRSIASITIRNAAGAGIQGKVVSLVSSDSSVIEVSNSPFTTDVNGVILVDLTGKSKGDTVMIASFEDQEFSVPMNVGDAHIHLTCPDSATVGVDFGMAATVTRGDGSKINAAEVSFTGVPAFSPVIPDSPTGPDGIARVNHTEQSNSDFEVTATVGPYSSNVCNLAVSVAP